MACQPALAIPWAGGVGCKLRHHLSLSITRPNSSHSPSSIILPKLCTPTRRLGKTFLRSEGPQASILLSFRHSPLLPYIIAPTLYVPWQQLNRSLRPSADTKTTSPPSNPAAEKQNHISSLPALRPPSLGIRSPSLPPGNAKYDIHRIALLLPIGSQIFLRNYNYSIHRYIICA